MNNDEKNLNTPKKNFNKKYLNTYKISELKHKINHNQITFSQIKNLILKDSSFKVGNYNNNDNIKTQLILYNTNSNKKNKKKLSKIISTSEEQKLTKSKSKLIQKTKIHKKDFALAERLFLSSRYAFSNLNNYENENKIEIKHHTLFKLSKDTSCPKINNLKYHFHFEKDNNIKNNKDFRSVDFDDNNKEKNENKNVKTLKNDKKKFKTEINDKDNLKKKLINENYNNERNEIENKEIYNFKKEKIDIKQLKQIGKNKINFSEKKEKQVEKEKKEIINNLKSIDFKTIEISENDERKNDNKEYSLINIFTEKGLKKKFSSRFFIESIDHSNTKKTFSNTSFDVLNQMKKNDIINPEEQHFICVNFQQNLKIMNTLIN